MSLRRGARIPRAPSQLCLHAVIRTGRLVRLHHHRQDLQCLVLVLKDTALVESCTQSSRISDCGGHQLQVHVQKFLQGMRAAACDSSSGHEVSR